MKVKYHVMNVKNGETMIKKFGLFLGSLFLLFSFSGCVVLLAGAIGGAGTSVWLSDKLVQEVNAPMDKSFEATKRALKKLKLKVAKEVKKDEVAQIVSEYYDGKMVWIDIHPTSMKSSKIEVRVGMTGDKEAAKEILDKILAYL